MQAHIAASKNKTIIPTVGARIPYRVTHQLADDREPFAATSVIRESAFGSAPKLSFGSVTTVDLCDYMLLLIVWFKAPRKSRWYDFWMYCWLCFVFI